tara:strand:+ start:268 stop:993 length:726 start_codon:yes stop_codon:yes gene_type:complete
MPLEQKNNPFKRLNESLQSFGKRHSAWQQKRREIRDSRIASGKTLSVKERSDRKYGHGDYAKGGTKQDRAMLPGESKWNYDIRMRKLDRKNQAATSAGVDVNEKIITPASEDVIQETIYGSGHSTSDWDQKGDDGYSLNELVEIRNSLDKSSEEYSRIQASINAAYENKNPNDMRPPPVVVEENYNPDRRNSPESETTEEEKEEKEKEIIITDPNEVTPKKKGFNFGPKYTPKKFNFQKGK